MKKLMFAVVAIFMFASVCPTLVMAQEPEKPATEQCDEKEAAQEEAPAETTEEASAE